MEEFSPDAIRDLPLLATVFSKEPERWSFPEMRLLIGAEKQQKMKIPFWWRRSYPHLAPFIRIPSSRAGFMSNGTSFVFSPSSLNDNLNPHMVGWGAQNGSATNASRNAVDQNEPSLQSPTIFHLTHWKAGSQWLHRMFHHLAYDRLVLPNAKQSQFLHEPIIAGKIYPTVYVTKNQFDAVNVPENHRRFLVIRDLRDTLVSLAFSMLYSHPVEHGKEGDVEGFRKQFGRSKIEEVMLHLLEVRLVESAEIQQSWLEAGEPFIRYCDMLEQDVTILSNLFLTHCQLDIPADRVQQVIIENRFEKVTGGRSRGQEDVLAHERKAVAGDWKNHFTPRIIKRFKERFGDLLILSGYEKDVHW